MSYGGFMREISDLKVELLRLQYCLATVLGCDDRRCHLCPHCLHAVQPPVAPVDPPPVADDSPIRVYRRPRRKGEHGDHRSP